MEVNKALQKHIAEKRQPGALFFRDALKGLEKVTARSLREEA